MVSTGQPSPPSRARQSQPGSVSLWLAWVGSWSVQVSLALLLVDIVGCFFFILLLLLGCVLLLLGRVLLFLLGESVLLLLLGRILLFFG